MANESALPPRCRFVACASPEYTSPDAAPRWYREHLPPGVTPAETVAYCFPDHLAVNAALRETFVAIVAANLLVPEAMEIATRLIAEWRAARAWVDAGKPDPNRERRGHDDHFLIEAPAICTAARRLAEHLRRDGRHAATLPLLHALDKSKKQGVWIASPARPGETVCPAAALADFLEHYAEELWRGEETVRSSVFLHRCAAGPFVFARDDNDHKDRIDTLRIGAAWVAEEIARMATYAPPPSLPVDRCRAPDSANSRPLWGVAAAFANDVAGSGWTDSECADAVRKFRKRHKGVQFVGWPPVARPRGGGAD